MKCEYITLMDFTFEDCEIINCRTIEDIENKISESKILIIEYDNQTYYINASYVMYFQVKE